MSETYPKSTDWEIIEFWSYGRSETSILAATEVTALPIEVTRVYWIGNLALGEVRGNHAHIELEQVYICASGSLRVFLDNGTIKEAIVLDNPAFGLKIGPGVWRKILSESPRTCLLVFANKPYEEKDYIRGYEDFLSWKQNINQS
jgi:hypothetical protein